MCDGEPIKSMLPNWILMWFIFDLWLCEKWVSKRCSSIAEKYSTKKNSFMRNSYKVTLSIAKLRYIKFDEEKHCKGPFNSYVCALKFGVNRMNGFKLQNVAKARMMILLKNKRTHTFCVIINWLAYRINDVDDYFWSIAI